MDNLATYNRVPSLESSLVKNSLTVAYSLLILLFISSLITALLWPSVWPYAPITAIAALLLYSVIVIANTKRLPRCQFCQSPLSTAIRPFLLSAQYLTMKGSKQGDYFITHTAWGSVPFKKRWVKISNHAKTCHHCRLIEEHYKPNYQPLSADELAKYQSNQQHNAD